MTEQVAFVAGATGYTGREVVRALRGRGIRTIAHVRPDSSRLEHWREQFEALDAETDSTSWEQEAMGASLARLCPTLVFALLGITRTRAKGEAKAGLEASTYESVDYGLTALLRRAAHVLEPSPRFIYLSSAAVKEGSPGSYMNARWEVEQELLAGTMPYTIARPSFITGADRDDGRMGERVGSAVMDAALGMAGLFGAKRMRNRYHSTSNTALADALVRLALAPEAENHIFESEDLR
jgi:uncharacterized protein YbjT (DUF2867 family)